jgi:hypothetical protein
MKKLHRFLTVAVIVLLVCLWFVEVFPDPYHQEGDVNIYIWIVREIEELIYGERTALASFSNVLL